MMKSAFPALVVSVALVACASSRTFEGDVQLSPSTMERTAPPGVKVTVTKTAILVEGVVVATIAGGKVDPKLKSDGADGYRLVPLVEELEKRPDSVKHTGKRVATRVTLAFDRSLPYRLFTEVVFSCGQAGFDKYDLIVRKATRGSLAAIDITIPEASEDRLTTTVWVTNDGFQLIFAGDWVLLRKLADGRYDHERLRTSLIGLKAAVGDASSRGANLGAEGNVPYEVLVATMDTMRWTNDHTPLFPQIAFAAAVK
jgi:biopolymer transport protein ExbD